MQPIIGSVLDTDLYIISMSCAYLFGNQCEVKYSEVSGVYEFINRGQTLFPEGFAKALQCEVDSMADLRLTVEEAEYLRKANPYFRDAYIDFLCQYRFNPKQVEITQNGGHLRVRVVGPLYSAVFWEVPLLAIISELYYRMTHKTPDVDWFDKIRGKSNFYGKHQIKFGDFGTRRRFSYETQDTFVSHMVRTCETFIGTSNVHLAQKYRTKSLGTQAHQWTQTHGALFGYKMANTLAMQAWVNEYQGDLGIALTDTYTSEVFFKAFGTKFAKLFDGIRQDSGSCRSLADQGIRHYASLGIDPGAKTIIFSDSLVPEKTLRVRNYCRNKSDIGCVFGVGTNSSNDCGHDPLSIVIKLVGIIYQGRKYPAVKLSDVLGKETGDPNEVNICKSVYGISR